MLSAHLLQIAIGCVGKSGKRVVSPAAIAYQPALWRVFQRQLTDGSVGVRKVIMAYAKRGAWVAAAIGFIAACAESEPAGDQAEAGACVAPAQCMADAAPVVTTPDAGGGPAPAPVDASVPPQHDTGAVLPPVDAGPNPLVDAGDAGGPPVTPPGTGKSGCLKGTSADYRANGPYQVKSKEVMLDALGPYTIFYPTELSTDCPHPIVGWGNGTGVTGSGTYAHFFRHAASWGIVTIAAHNENSGSMPYIAGGIDYLLKENMTSGSEFFGKLSTRAGTAGHSQGGFAALTASSHPNVKAIVNVQGGGRAPASAAMICLTGVMDFVRMQCTSSYTGARGPAFLADHNMADHTGTPTPLGSRSPAGQEYIRMYSSWFRCFLGDDQTACALYRGAMPPVCAGGDWATCAGKAVP